MDLAFKSSHQINEVILCLNIDKIRGKGIGNALRSRDFSIAMAIEAACPLMSICVALPHPHI